ncbi:uncharacterized protein PGTG_04331 [Puccinia graminis f. sp. tritici CRL 75-36-700-3]|uniref:Uncharacterized protein n=1 Tax=Puccinia graminis f. sp. tritici (strain CRL 75-36-700-3 / race SCCL) TaxID=418459 RepID=E3K206_PUCGT|nr:uncharacterized protein PGTG_04331 [Puccinia graminis f. sp. tritici CRL 75-36-700-3]EFP78375.1 hypothetical protein PGTG_04331 [Puccinia graminis f. sp. tritici CRL 75-36-700-3]
MVFRRPSDTFSKDFRSAIIEVIAEEAEQADMLGARRVQYDKSIQDGSELVIRTLWDAVMMEEEGEDSEDAEDMDEKRCGRGGRRARRGCPFHLKDGLVETSRSLNTVGTPFEHFSKAISKDANFYRNVFRRQLRKLRLRF